jgi:putative ABC transport system permease protein
MPVTRGSFKKAVAVGFRLPFVGVDHDFFDTFGMKLIAGRTFSRGYPTDSTEAFVLNETAVAKLGWTSPQGAVGKPLGYGQHEGRVIGVVKDFNFESMHQSIKPMLFQLSPFLRRISIRIRPENVPGTMAFLQDKWLSWRPDYPFNYYFIDERFEQRYESDTTLGKVFALFAVLAAFIACLGLFGLAAFTTEQRTKEIGIRKVLGATVTNLIHLLSVDFVKLVLLANLLAWPVAWYAMNKWLQNFAYRMDVEWWIFVLAGGLALLIALLTVSTQAVRAALANPVDSLHYE